MIGKITPLVKEAGWRTWFGACASHTAGLLASSTLQGATLALIAALIGLRSSSIGLNIWAALCLVLAVLDSQMVRVGTLSSRRQTPAEWQCVYGHRWAALLWGLDLGLGWTVQLPFAAYWGLVAWVVVAPNMIGAVLPFAAYAIGKALPVLAGPILERSLARSGRLVLECVRYRNAATALVAFAASLAGTALLVGWPSR